MKSKSIYVIFTLLIYFITSGLSFNNAVLCFGEDGHVKVELGFCSDADASTINPENSIDNLKNPQIKSNQNLFSLIHINKDGDGCGKCTDIALYTDSSFHEDQIILPVLFHNTNTLYSYYPIKIEKQEIKSEEFSLKDRIKIEYPKLTDINTSTTVLLN